MPFNIQYLARNSSSGNIDAGKLWVYNGTGVLGSNESLATISASGYFNAAQVTLDAIFAAGSTGTTGQLAVNDIIQINGNDATGVFVVTSVTGNVTVVAQSGGGSGTITGATSLGGTFPIYANQSGSTLQFNGVTLGAGLTGSVSGGALSADVATSAVTPGSYTSTNLTVDAYGRITAAADGSGGSSFAYEQAFWVSQANGNDSNAGTSIETPLATVQAAINLIASGAPVIIYVVDANGSNNETIVTPGLGYTISISAPGTSFQGSITQAAGDEVILEALYVDAFVSNSSSNSLISGGNMNVTSTTTGTVYARLNQYTGFHTGGGAVLLDCNELDGINLDNTMTAFINAPYANGITNAGSLNLNTTVPPASCIVSNTGTINGNVGGVLMGTAGVGPGSTSGAAYALPLVDGTANYFLQTDGAGTVTWQPGGGGFTPFAYANQFWVTATGNDSNPGTSIETPFQTLQNAINNVSGGTPTIINWMDEINTETITLPTGCNIYINAPLSNIAGSWSAPGGTSSLYMNV
jgi:hypothetical protein